MDNNLVGQIIQGRYYVVKQLGRGGVGVTFLAKDQQCFDSPCVVKQLKPKTATSKTLAIARRLFNREADIMNRLGHCDRIPRLLAYFEHDQDFFLVQELIEGHDLSQEIITGQPWSESKTISLLQDVLEVLAIVQQHSVIHRDLKPSNLMRRQQDQKIVLIDFGSVKQISTQIIDTAGQVKQTVAVGTKSYMPIEQMMGRPGFYSDIYALGVIAIQALSGTNPKTWVINDNGEFLWRKQLRGKRNFQPRLLDLLDRMVCYRHQERYSSATAVLNDLQQLDAVENETQDTVIMPHRQSAETARPQVKASSAMASAQPSPPVGQTVEQTQISAVPAPRPTVVSRSTRTKKGAKKKVLWPALAGILAILAAAGGWLFYKRQAVEPEVNLSLYENTNQGFAIEYPEQWTQQNREDIIFSLGVVMFVSPEKDETDKFKERVSVYVEGLPEEMTLAEYTEQSVAEIQKLSDPNVGTAQTVSLGDNEGRQVVYDGEENGRVVRRQQSWSVKDDQAYVITYTAEPESYEEYLPTVQKMLSSFETLQ